jgi:hypothetical protein
MNWLCPRWLFLLVNAYLIAARTPVSMPRRTTTRRPNMIPIEQHEQELFWLKRRIKYLEALHSHINRSPDEETIASLHQQYSKVATPRDLLERLEEVYEGDLP